MKKVNATKTYIYLYKRNNDGELIYIDCYSRFGRFSKVKEEKMLKEKYGKGIEVDYIPRKVVFNQDDILDKLQEIIPIEETEM